MIKNISRFVVLLILIFSYCKGKEDPNETFIDDFPQELKPNVKIVKELHNAIPNRIIVNDSLVFIVNSNNEDTLINAYDKVSFELKESFALKGDGPKEFRSIGLVGQQFFKNGSSTDYAYDYSSQKVVDINLISEVGDNRIGESHIELPQFFNGFFKFFFISDSLTISIPLDRAENRFKIYKDGVEINVPYFSNPPFEINNENLSNIYANVGFSINEKKRIFVGAPNLLGQYDFFNFNGDYLYTSVIDRDVNLIEQATVPDFVDQRVLPHYITEIIGDEEKFYSLFFTMSASNGLSNSVIHVLDWEGNPISKYVFDRVIFSFAFDRVDNCFYGLSYNATDDDYFYIVKWEL
ncbi:BF3164 family lipoprotein [Algoriphagus antarcticus]|uniref:TolB-like protein n=1 Tax=Algoriphagus antarcticus TaxID=238540 RepID=A0A3E0DNK8_9BACT|nr:hypothetical protein [Algoriphagus antarcticus]REG84434.1 TolB-like protein [Algoriphagus antarcticus]